jgi:hypothetical protein
VQEDALGTADRKRRYDDHAATRHGAAHHLGELVLGVVCGVRPRAVRALEHHRVARGRRLRRAQQRVDGSPDVAREDDHLAVDLHADHRRAQDVTHRVEGHLDVVGHDERLVERHRADQGDRVLGVAHRVERLGGAVLGPAATVGVLRLLLLEVGGVG